MVVKLFEVRFTCISSFGSRDGILVVIADNPEQAISVAADLMPVGSEASVTSSWEE
jgi:hypothetical protein